jgi:hypothetical protein
MSADTSQEVLCPNPSCGKRYRLKGAIPAVFTCTKCGQAMDLSAFGGAPEPKAPATRSSRGGAPGGGGRRAASRREREEEQDDDRRPRFEAKPKSNTPLILGSLGGLVVMVVVLLLVMKKDPPPPAPVESGNAGTGAPAQPAPAGGPVAPVAPGVPVPGVPAAVPGAGPAPAAPAAGQPSEPAQPAAAPQSPPRRGGGLSALQTWEPPAELGVTAEEKDKIEKAVHTAINDTGRSQREAEDLLVSLNRKAVWRVVSEFKNIHDSLTFEQRKGMVNAMIVDRILRKIDGWMERTAKIRDRINPESSPDWAAGVAKRWNTWLEKGYWKETLAPWDPRTDEADEGAEKPGPSGRR